jgi:hypothetical protein
MMCYESDEDEDWFEVFITRHNKVKIATLTYNDP